MKTLSTFKSIEANAPVLKVLNNVCTALNCSPDESYLNNEYSAREFLKRLIGGSFAPAKWQLERLAGFIDSQNISLDIEKLKDYNLTSEYIKELSFEPATSAQIATIYSYYNTMQKTLPEGVEKLSKTEASTVIKECKKYCSTHPDKVKLSQKQFEHIMELQKVFNIVCNHNDDLAPLTEETVSEWSAKTASEYIAKCRREYEEYLITKPSDAQIEYIKELSQRAMGNTLTDEILSTLTKETASKMIKDLKREAGRNWNTSLAPSISDPRFAELNLYGLTGEERAAAKEDAIKRNFCTQLLIAANITYDKDEADKLLDDVAAQDELIVMIAKEDGLSAVKTLLEDHSTYSRNEINNILGALKTMIR